MLILRHIHFKYENQTWSMSEVICKVVNRQAGGQTKNMIQEDRGITNLSCFSVTIAICISRLSHGDLFCVICLSICHTYVPICLNSELTCSLEYSFFHFHSSTRRGLQMVLQEMLFLYSRKDLVHIWNQ